MIILPAGYFGSTIFGGVFMLGGFDTLVAKILSFVLGLGLITPLVLVRDKLWVYAFFFNLFGQLTNQRTILLTILYEGLLVGFWFIGHA